MTTWYGVMYAIIGIVLCYFFHKLSMNLFWGEDMYGSDGLQLGEFIMSAMSWAIFWPFHILILIFLKIASLEIMSKRVR